MPSEELRRKAGASGVGDSGVESAVLGVGEKRGKRKREERKKPEDQANILRPEVLTFPIKRGGLPATLHVPVVPTIGDVIDRRAQDDIGAYTDLVLLEGTKLSGIDSSRPELLFLNDNAIYLAIAVTTAAVQDYLRRIVTKTGWVDIDGGAENERLRIVASDLDQLERNDIVRIGTTIYGQEIARRWEASKAANPPKAARV